jgi:hypothetical protein
VVSVTKGPNRVNISFSSSEDGKRSSFMNVMFATNVEFREMDEVQKRSDSER